MITNPTNSLNRTRAQESSHAIQRMYITMRHLFSRGFYKPMGVSGSTLRQALLSLRPEIYGTIAEEKNGTTGLAVCRRSPSNRDRAMYAYKPY